ELPLRAEIVGGNAGHKSRTMTFIQQKQFRVGPNVTRVRRNEKGEVTDQLDACGAGIFPEAFALAEQQELRESNLLDRFRELAPRSGRGCRLTAEKFRGPIEVVSTAVSDFQRSEQSVVVQPMGLVETKLVIVEPQVRAPIGAEAPPGRFKQLVFEGDDRVVINGVFQERTPLITIAGSQESFFDQAVRADEQPVACERRQALVGRVAVTRGTEGQRLPPALACCL